MHIADVSHYVTEGSIEIFGILRVDSAGEYLSEVLTFLVVLFCDFARNLVGSILYVFRIFIRQSVLCEDRVHFYIIVTHLSEDVNNFTDRAFVFSIRPFDDTHYCLIIGLSSFYLSLVD